MRTIAAALAACVAAGCATPQRNEGSTSVVRTRPPANYQDTVTNYFDVHVRGPQTNRKLAFGSPESSDCALRGSSGAYKGWMVPVIYDTTASTAATSSGAKRPAGNSRDNRVATSASGTAPAGKAAAGSTGNGPVTLDEVRVSGKGYFFWFSNDTIAAVSRRADNCP